MIPGYEDLTWDEATRTLSNYTFDGAGTQQFIPDETINYVNLTVKNLVYNGLKGDGVYNIDGLTIDCGSSFGNNWYAAETSKVKNLKLISGWTSLFFDIEGGEIHSGYIQMQKNHTFSDVTIYGGSLTLGNNGYWGAYNGNTSNVTLKGGTLYQISGLVENLTATGGIWEIRGNLSASGYTKGEWYFKGAFDLTNVKIQNTQDQQDIVMTDITSFRIGSSCIIEADIVGDKDVTIYGYGNWVSSGTARTFSIKSKNIILDQVQNWFGSAIVNRISAFKQTGDLIFNGRLGQGLYSFGDVDDTFTGSIKMNLGGQTFTMTFGDADIEKDGYIIKMYVADGKGYLSVMAKDSSNTELGWSDISWSASKKYAVKYVNDLAASTSGTINLGDKMENAGGNGVNDAFGTISTGGIITAAQTGTTIFGGASDKDIATTWLKVTGGAKNVIYGGGNGKNITDGTNVYINGDKTLTTAMVFGGGKDSTVSVGANNVYAVNMDVAGGRHRYVYGGGENCVINGNIGVWVYDTLVFSIFSGAGSSDVNGNINVSLDLPSYEGSKMSGNFYGGAVPVVGTTGTVGRNSNIVGNINMKLSSSVDAPGAYEGLIFGGSRAWGSVANVDGDINLTVKNIVHTDNLKLIAAGKGNSAWIVGGSQIANNGATAGTGLITGTVNMTIGVSSLSNVVGGGQAQGAGAALTVDAVNLSINGATIANGIYGAGYAAQGGSVTVGSNLITISASADSATTIQGYVYAAGYVVGSGSVNVINDSTVAFTGDGNYLTIGTVNGLGKGNCSVGGMTVASFNNFTGEFSGTLVNFDAVGFGGDTVGVTMANAYESSVWSFNVIGRTATEMFSSDPDSFNLVGDERAINLIIDTKKGFSFDLIDVTGEELDGVTVNLLDANNNSLGSFAFGGSLVVDKGTITLEDVDGILSVNYNKGVLA